jgi:hypothetical protein
LVREPATTPAVSAAPLKWSPPVIEMLVDPWAKGAAPVHTPRPRWVPRAIEIVDPWADETPAPPRVAAGPVIGHPATIF